MEREAVADEALRKLLTILAIGNWVCECTRQTATCFGGYDKHDQPGPHCDECCDHNCEGGWCIKLPVIVFDDEAPEATH